MQDMMFAMMLWIGASTAYNVDLPLPNITLTDSANICANYGIQHKGQCEASGLIGYYNRHHTIYLPFRLDFAKPANQARLMHELVHYVQWANLRHKNTCLGHLEVEAYDIQDKWRARFGLGESIDPFRKILLAASCDD